jgi:hypothetical protein
MTRLRYAALFVGAALVLHGATAHADEYGSLERGPASGFGIGVIAGVGLTGFSSSHVRDSTSTVGGLWDLRVTVGSHIPIGIDISYVGSSTTIDSLIGSNRGTLLGTAVEGALRWNILPHLRVNPYLFGGVGWQRYDITGASFTLSDAGVNDSDNLVDFPVGAGLAYREAGFVADIRGTYRFTTDNNLIVEQPLVPRSGFAKMDSWEASAAVGFEF